MVFLIQFRFLFIWILILMVFFSACTIEKRIYRPGYSIEWNINDKNAQSTERLPVASDHIERLPPVDNVVTHELLQTLVEVNNRTEPIRGSHYGKSIRSNADRRINPSVRSSETNSPKDSSYVIGVVQDTTRSLMASPPEIHPEARTAFILGLVSWFLPLIIPNIFAIAFAISALIRIKKNPEKWRGKGYAILGMSLAILGLLLIVLFAIAIRNVSIGW